MRQPDPGHHIACVQNLLNLADRRSMSALEECHARGIAFLPFVPLGSGFARDGNPVQASPAVAATAARSAGLTMRRGRDGRHSRRGGLGPRADIEIFTRTTTFAIMRSIRLDRGPSGPVHP